MAAKKKKSVEEPAVEEAPQEEAPQEKGTENELEEIRHTHHVAYVTKRPNS